MDEVGAVGSATRSLTVRTGAEFRVGPIRETDRMKNGSISVPNKEWRKFRNEFVMDEVLRKGLVG